MSQERGTKPRRNRQKRRPRNNVYKDKRTGKFVARILDAHGRRKSKVFEREHDAIVWLSRQRVRKHEVVKAARDGRPLPEPEQPRPLMLVKDFAKEWLAAKVEDELAHSTQLRYQQNIDWICSGPLGALSIDELNLRRVESWLQELYGETKVNAEGETVPRYSYNTIKNMISVLKPMTHRLYVEHELARWACEGMKIPKRVRKRKGQGTVAMSKAELARFLAALDKHFKDTNWRAIFWTCAATGMRPCEVLALHRHHLDFKRGRILVEMSAYNGKLRDETKTGFGREPAMVKKLASVLRPYAARVKTGELVFTSKAGGPHWESSLGDPFARALELAKIKPRPGLTVYSLRKTFNTIAVLSGANELVLRNVMGHSDKAMTERYMDTPLTARAELQERVIATLPGV